MKTGRRPRGRCRQCGRIIQLTTNGKLFLHGQTPAVREKGASEYTEFGPTCPGGLTTEFDPHGFAAMPMPAREART